MNCKCAGKTAEDCNECNLFYSGHSLHYSIIHGKKVSEINCSIGGNKTFDEDGEEV